MKKEKLTQDVIYPHPVQRVWTALTRSNELAQWLLPNDFSATVGHHFTFTSNADHGERHRRMRGRRGRAIQTTILYMAC